MTALIRVEDGGLWFEGERLGSDEALLADPAELKSLTPTDGVLHKVLPERIDLLFGAGERSVGAESKRPSDLISSTKNRRLHRQLRRLLKHVDVPCLVLRGGLPPFLPDLSEIFINLVRIQALGITLLPLPVPDQEALKWLIEYREILATNSTAPIAALAGTDATHKAKGTLSMKVRGLGAKRLDALARLALAHAPKEAVQAAIGKGKLWKALEKEIKQ